MATTTETADLEEVLRASQERRPVDPEVAQRVAERAERIKVEIARNGLTDLAVPLVRSGREQ